MLEEFLTIVSLETGNRELIENDREIILTLWENEIDYKGKKINIIRQIKKNKETKNIVNECG